MTTGKQHVIFLCTGNSARSQMAEAFLRKYGSDRFEPHSAGLEPRDIHPLTHRVMEEAGISLEGHYPKTPDEFLGKVPIRHAIVVCERAERECPRLWPFGATVYSWPFDDPAAAEGTEEEQLKVFRNVRDAIERRIRRWLDGEVA
ncbi:Arsenate-mycothiol transferase ArsC2 [Maioricimonas rarisocia]|uniref:Arsenate-mycothiol transferase ArsC2 n=1 Tax=Maioricimonas rarisocia TaxID=2528026 RepID=A0A517Z6B4_9PLAN|nr:arsenate reductase ArsC [Maioricimonas rarisocia]QDU38026.1 Arsenate-mycothiol transferase ArsC2 [Maioricimonas rarisocia]